MTGDAHIEPAPSCSAEVAGLATDLAVLTVDHDDPPAEALERIRRRLALGPDGEACRVEDVRDLVVANLLAHEHIGAAWAVVQDFAAGLIDRPFTGGTSAGSRRRQAPIPVLTFTEGTRAFAWLPGFRDPRYGAADDCYDISPLVEPEVRLDEIAESDGRLLLSGSARWRHLSAEASDEVTVSLSSGATAPSWVRAVRTHRSQLTTGSRTGLTAGAWAGWHVELPLREEDLRERATLRIQMSRGPFVRLVMPVPATGDVARAAAASTARAGLRRYRIGIGDGRVTVMAVPPLPVRAVRKAGRLMSRRRP